MGGILSRAEGSPKASQNACRQSVLGSIDLVSRCVDFLVVDELYGSARPVCHAWRAAADLTPGRLWVESRSVAELVGYDGRNFQRWHALGAAGQQPYRDLAARDAELATAKAEIAACKEQIKKKEADKKFVEEMTIIPLKKRLAAVRDKLAREMAKNKHLSAAVCPRTSPLCDATNA